MMEDVLGETGGKSVYCCARSQRVQGKDSGYHQDAAPGFASSLFCGLYEVRHLRSLGIYSFSIKRR